MATGTLTLPVSEKSARTVRVEVTEGPDAGKVSAISRDKISIGTAQGNDLVLTDPTVSRYHAELSTSKQGILVVDLESTNGTRSGNVRIERATMKPGSVLRIGETQVRVSEGTTATVSLVEGFVLGGIVGRSSVMRRLMASVQDAASAASSVLVVGESGTGKELIARALHDHSPRASGPFVTLDCAGLPPAIVTSELFGHERGAFTGAHRQHIGAFERASGGTIFLDELGELPESVQANLLGVLERRSFRRVGGNEEVSVDVRVVTATNRDLRAEVNAGRFRLDLYYRTAVVVIEVPPLRDRAEDIPLLVEHFMRQLGYDGPLEDLFPQQSLGAFSRHRWPGNVRELRNLIEATVAIGEAPKIEAAPVLSESPEDPIGQVLELDYREARRTLLGSFEVRYLKRLLEVSNGNVSKASRQAKMDRSHLIDLLKRHGLK